MYSLGQAARAVGKAKSTLSRAVETGRLSAARQQDGSLLIDPAELHRVYPAGLRSNGSSNAMSNDSQPQKAGARTAAGTVALRHEIELLRRDGESLRSQLAERERLVTEQAEAIRDLRARLDAEAEERRRMLALLTGPRASSWWRRWFRR